METYPVLQAAVGRLKDDMRGDDEAKQAVERRVGGDQLLLIYGLNASNQERH